MHQWDRLLDQYICHCQVIGLSSQTIKARQRELERWGAWLKRRRPRPTLEQVSVDPDHVRLYLQGRCVGRSKQTLSSVMSHMRMMGEYLVAEGEWVQNPLRWMRGPKLRMNSRVPRTISRSRMQKLWREASMNRFHLHRSRMLAMLGVFYGTGIRRGELSRLKLSDWDRETGILRVDGRKSRTERQSPVPETTWRLLEAWLPVRQNHLEVLGAVDHPALFITKDGGWVKPEAITASFSKLVRRADLEGVTLHGLRHSCATDLLEAGASVPEIKHLLGHACIETTVRYLNTTGRFRHEAVSLHPINHLLAQEVCHEG